MTSKSVKFLSRKKYSTISIVKLNNINHLRFEPFLNNYRVVYIHQELYQFLDHEELLIIFSTTFFLLVIPTSENEKMNF